MGDKKLPNLKGYVCLVTGASRGIGRGIALALGECGATVYITGRTLKPKDDAKEGDAGGSLEETAAEITTRGGFALSCFSFFPRSLFPWSLTEQNGRLDLLVNNAFAAVSYLTSHSDMSYWELEADDSTAKAWDVVNGVGLRNHYICATLATRMMLEYRGEFTTESSDHEKKTSGNEKNSQLSGNSQRPGLIINISSLGGLKYLFNVAYGVGKAAMDRMAADMAHELHEKKKNIAIISLWPGMVRTEQFIKFAKKSEARTKILEERGESPELTGIVIAHLLVEPKEKLLSRSGRVPFVADTALEMGIRDTNGKWPTSLRSLRYILEISGRTTLSRTVPEFVRVPYSAFNQLGTKF
ncbi:unnamed protein product [Schistocephalus solidus]|uniref:Dehydrogenase/reductase SDR family member 1 n=1 Tax=Schistocephalus solidus TaxID=70667 RepID=A0A183TIP0_SCHSO|nr:unnamed protein product [Schistocephalus solidus]